MPADLVRERPGVRALEQHHLALAPVVVALHLPLGVLDRLRLARRAQRGLCLLARARAHADPALLAEEAVDQPLPGIDQLV